MTIAFAGVDHSWGTTQFPSTQLYVMEPDGSALRNLTGGCAVGPESPFGYFCVEEGGASVPLRSAVGPFAVRTHIGGRRLFWGERGCRCLSLQIALRDQRGLRVRAASVSVSSVPEGLLVAPARAHYACPPCPSTRSTLTSTPGTITFWLSPTRELRRLRPRAVSIAISVEEQLPNVTRLLLPAPGSERD